MDCFFMIITYLPIGIMGNIEGFIFLLITKIVNPNINFNNTYECKGNHYFLNTQENHIDIFFFIAIDSQKYRNN
jgi:hypothetical protein